jgi:hypothetical protein
MSAKIGRNDPCPCGSGRKYKQCCGKPEAPPAPPADSHEGVVQRVVAWLGQNHRKAFVSALEEAVDAAAMACFDDDEQAAADAIARIDDELWSQLQINLTEWLLAEGDIAVKGGYQRVSELLLGPRGPLLTVGQRAWLAQLAQRPLRLYDVTDVVAGTGVTLCDAVDAEAAPVFVDEREGSRTMRPGMQVAARVMAVGDGHQLSGAIYSFSTLGGHAVQRRLRTLFDDPSPHAEDNKLMASQAIIDGWLAQFLRPPPLPDIVDAGTGEGLQLTTDHYEVRDWLALESALSAQPDVEGAAAQGWVRLAGGDEAPHRPLAGINPLADRRKVSVFYRTAGLAEQGRAWFERLAGDAVKFLAREIVDPKGALSRAQSGAPPPVRRNALPEGISPQDLAQVLAEAIGRSYANWPDEPIPALNGKTPRQAIKTTAGLERVKGLLRSYEDGEERMAAQQGRDRISYQFLWDALGLGRG